jgi:3',5'-cyclic-AMP phosphodiesterase
MLIAQFSDTHIKQRGRLAYNRVDTAQMLVQAVRHLQHLPQKPDLLMITGDLVDHGQVEEYEHLISIMSENAIPMIVIPGNHDDRDVMRQCFKDLVIMPEQGYWQFRLHQKGWPIQIVALDTCVPGESHGDLCKQRLQWLEVELEQSKEIPTLIIMHHPPFLTGIGHMDQIGLKARDHFSEVVSKYPNIELITCGHLHRNIRAQVGKRAAMTCPSTAHAVQLDLDPDASASFRMEPAGYLLHLWTEEGLVTHESTTVDFEGPYPFFEPTGKLID